MAGRQMSSLAEGLRRGHQLARWAFAFTALSVVGISVLPGRDVPNIGLWDKLEHVIAYATLALVGAFAFPGFLGAALLAVLLPALGAVMEICQLFVPGRSAEFGDAVANTVGVALVLLPVTLFQTARRSYGRRRQS